MTLLRRIARPLLAASFIVEGAQKLANPGTEDPGAVEATATVAARVPALAGRSTTDLVRMTGGVQAGAGSLLAINRLPRISSLLLAATVVPSAAANRFWTAPASERKAQQQRFLTDLSLLGGLLIASADLAGRPGLSWRARAAGRRTERAVTHRKREAKAAGRAATRSARAAGRTAKAALPV
jgi:putative oxidoreductase